MVQYRRVYFILTRFNFVVEVICLSLTCTLTIIVIKRPLSLLLSAKNKPLEVFNTMLYESSRALL